MTPQLITHTTKTAIPSWPWNSAVRTDCDNYTGLHQWLLLQFIVLLMMDTKGV